MSNIYKFNKLGVGGVFVVCLTLKSAAAGLLVSEGWIALELEEHDVGVSIEGVYAHVR